MNTLFLSISIFKIESDSNGYKHHPFEFCLLYQRFFPESEVKSLRKFALVYKLFESDPP